MGAFAASSGGCCGCRGRRWLGARPGGWPRWKWSVAWGGRGAPWRCPGWAAALPPD